MNAPHEIPIPPLRDLQRRWLQVAAKVLGSAAALCGVHADVTLHIQGEAPDAFDDCEEQRTIEVKQYDGGTKMVRAYTVNWANAKGVSVTLIAGAPPGAVEREGRTAFEDSLQGLLFSAPTGSLGGGVR